MTKEKTNKQEKSLACSSTVHVEKKIMSGHQTLKKRGLEEKKGHSKSKAKNQLKNKIPKDKNRTNGKMMRQKRNP